MGRQLRFPYPGAVYHMMARGDGGKQLSPGKDDHGSFLHWLEQVCGSHGWRVHAWGIMGKHLPEAARIIRLTAGRVGLPAAATDLAKLRKGDPGKVACSALVRLRTAMPHDWIAARLLMGGSSYVSSLVNRGLKDPKARRALATHERVLDTQQETQ